MRICFLVVFISVVSARPEGGAYHYSPQLLTVPGNSGPISTGPCCQQLALLKGGGHANGLLSGHSSNGFGHGLTSAVVTSGYSATGGGGSGYSGRFIGEHSSGSAPSILTAPGPAGFVGGIGSPYGHGFSHGTGFSGPYSQGFGSGGGSIRHGGGSFGHGGHHDFSHGGSSFGHGGGLGSGGFSSLGVGIGSQGLTDFKPTTLGNFQHGGFSSSSANSFNSIGIDATAQFGPSIVSDNSGSLVQKHIYVHVPPPDSEEEHHTAKLASLVQPRKHYKIIFIKAPSVQTPSAAQIIASNAQTEEKTLVYVLVKKPDEPSIEQLQALQNNVHHSKPEVFFIKYKAKKHGHFGGGGGHGLIENSFPSGAGLAEVGGSFASGGGVSLTSNIGSAHNIAHVSPSPTPYIPPPIIEPRQPLHEEAGLIDSYGPPPEVV